MFTFSPGDNKVSDRHSKSAPTDARFGGRREVTENADKAEDYTKPSKERRANMAGDTEEKISNPIGETTDDIDDMNDPKARKREASRRAETSHVGAQNEYRRPGDGDDKEYTEANNRPGPDAREDDHRVPEKGKKHGSRNPWRLGQDFDEPEDQNIGHDQKPR